MDAQGRPTLDAARLVEILDGVPVLLYVQDPEGRITYANQVACDLVGKSPGDVVGRMPEELFDPDTVERWAAQNAEVLRTGRPLDIEDGWGERTHLTHKTPVFDAAGRPVAVIGLSTDITERKRAEERLTEAQQIAGVGSWHWDPEAHAIMWSPELRRMLGIEPGAETVGDDTLELVHPDDRERVAAASRAAMDTGGTMEIEYRMRHADGAYRLLLCRAGATIGPDGTVRRFDGVCQDLTDIRAAERARIELDERFRSMFERAPVGIALVAPGGRFELVNEALAEFLGRDRSELVGMPVEEITHPDDMAQSTDIVRRMTAGELQEWNTEKRYVRPDGEVRWGALRALLVRDAEGRSSHCLSLIRDITEQLLAERRRAATTASSASWPAAPTSATRCPRSCRRWPRSWAGSAGACGSTGRSRRPGRARASRRTRRAGS